MEWKKFCSMEYKKDSVYSTGLVSTIKMLQHRQIVSFYNDVAVTWDRFSCAAANCLFVSIKRCRSSRHFLWKNHLPFHSIACPFGDITGTYPVSAINIVSHCMISQLQLTADNTLDGYCFHDKSFCSPMSLILGFTSIVVLVLLEFLHIIDLH